MGLLSRGAASKSQHSHEFYQFARRNNLRHCAIFSRINDKMLITDCVGLDVETITKSISSADFWAKQIDSSTDVEWLKITGEEIKKFEPLFALSPTAEMAALFLLQISADLIFIVVQQNGEHVLPPTIDSVKKYIQPTDNRFEKTAIDIISNFSESEFSAKKSYIWQISYADIIRKVIDSVTDVDDKAKKLLLTAANNAIFYKLADTCVAPNKAYCTDIGESRLVLFSATEIDSSLVCFHLAETMRSIVKVSENDSIGVNCLGVAETREKLESLLRT